MVISWFCAAEQSTKEVSLTGFVSLVLDVFSLTRWITLMQILQGNPFSIHLISYNPLYLTANSLRFSQENQSIADLHLMLRMWEFSAQEGLSEDTRPKFRRSVDRCVYIYDWWFGTFFILPYIGNSHPNWLIFSEGLKPPTRYNYIWRPEIFQFIYELW
jgi:hypothetical protein